MSEMSDNEVCLCAAMKIVDLIARKWSLSILNLISKNERLRFNRIIDQLPDISPVTLTETLEKLVAHGLIRRATYPEIPPRVEYSLTPEGIGLREAIRPLILWAAKYDPTRGKDLECPPFMRVSIFER